MIHPEHHGPDMSGNKGAIASATLHDRLGVYIAILALIIATLALGMVLMLPAQQAARVDMLADRAAKAEREARVMQERWNDLKVELAKKGIPVSDH